MRLASSLFPPGSCLCKRVSPICVSLLRKQPGDINLTTTDRLIVRRNCISASHKCPESVMHAQVLIDGVPLTEVDAQWYRSQIGVVAQDPRLFSNTITANITYGCTGKSQV